VKYTGGPEGVTGDAIQTIAMRQENITLDRVQDDNFKMFLGTSKINWWTRVHAELPQEERP
jgi:hypothetical protein